MSENYTREAAGLFKNREDLDKAIFDLEKHFPKQAFSVLGSEDALKRELGTDHVDPKEVIDEENVPRHAPIKPEEKTVGASWAIGGGTYVGAAAGALALGGLALPLTIAGAAVVGLAGGAVGGVLVKLIGDRMDETVEKQIEAGGLLLWVGVQTKEQEGTACRIMKEHGAEYVEVHSIPHDVKMDS